MYVRKSEHNPVTYKANPPPRFPVLIGKKGPSRSNPALLGLVFHWRQVEFQESIRYLKIILPLYVLNEAFPYISTSLSPASIDDKAANFLFLDAEQPAVPYLWRC